ncbi:hypothetical protein BGW39_000639 [Mortierella sp. 14UC]|nr:hypothetical protein BGW39_000639 [Mortierella sp. 14UC]
MSTEHEPVLSPKGCPIENFPEDPERLFSANGLLLDYPRIGWITAGCCTFLATAISLVLIYRHYQYYTKPNQQRYIVRMLLMVPIYAITSWFSFVYVREAIYYETIRVFYEAFVIASFLILLLQYLGDSLEDQKRALKRHKKTERWFFPMCCLKYNPSRPHFLQYMKWGILQYVPLNVIGSLLTVILETQGTYCESSWNPKFGHVWILFINFTSVTLATYFLIMFYFTVRTDLKEYEPFYKFLAIKLSLVVEGFVYFGYIKASKYWSTGDISIGINALLIDFEMVIFALIHLKAFSYKPYVPKIPNPDLPQPLLSPDGDRDNSNNNNNDPSLASLSDDTLPTATGGRTQLQQQQQAGGPKRKPAPTIAVAAIPIDNGRNSKSSSGKKADKKKSKKDEGPPEKIMDFTQKTPIWRGILDSFNPLDTIRELSYGCKYMYKWLRGIPVDKDSRRLLDLEVAFGRVRPEVPYTQTKEELERKKKKKKKDKERKKKGQESDEHGTSSNDDEDDDDSDDNSDKDLEKGTRRADDYDSDDDDGENNEKGRRRHESDDGEGTGAGQGAVSRYRQLQDSNRPGGRGGRRIDATYDIGEGPGAETVARKPVKAIKSATNAVLPHLERDPSIKLEKADAARTERATLPDIQLEPVERKIALSGLYVDLPLSPAVDSVGSPSSSVDIPIPMQYQHEYHHHHHHQYQSPYEAQESRVRGGGGRDADIGRDWDYDRRQRARDHRVEIGQEPSTSRFDRRDRDLERAAATASYILPAPVVPRSPEPHLPNTSATGASRVGRVGGGESVPVDINGPPRGGLTKLANDNFVTKGNPYQYDREFDDNNDSSKSRRNNGGKGFTRDPPLQTANDPRITALSYYGQQPHQVAAHHRSDSADTSVLTISTNPDSLAAPAGREGFYHHREASRSDPELSHYGHDHEHYLERMHYLQEQDRQAQYYLQLQQQQLQREERRRSQLPLSDHSEPSSTFASTPLPVHVPGPIDAPLAAAAPDRTSVFIQGEDSVLLPREMRKGKGQGEGESTLPPASGPDTIAAPVGNQVPDPGKVIDAAAAAAEQQKASQVVQEDPIVAEYNLLQHRQKLQEQQRTQQELQYQEQQQRRQLQHEQGRDNQQQRATMSPPRPPPPVRQPRQLLPQRRNSIESLDSDSSGGGFRVHDYGFRPTGGVGGGVSRVPKGSSSRYQQAYRYPMPLPQPVPPAQLYQFPQDRDLYDRQRRERNRDRDWDRDRDRNRDQQYYYQQQPYQQPQPHQQQQPQYFSRPYMDAYLRQPYMAQPQPQYGRSSADMRYRSPPLPTLLPLDDRSSRPIHRTQEPNPRDRRDRERDKDRDPRYTRERDTRDPYYPPEGPSENLFPASRYAAPFVRDYELQQRERDARQRTTRSPLILGPSSPSSSQQQTAQRWQQTTAAAAPPVIDRPKIPQPARRGGGDIDNRSKAPLPRQASGVAAYEDDGPYEEAVIWTRQQPIAVPALTLRD